MKSFAICAALASLVASTAAAPVSNLQAARQLVLVVTPGWNDVSGELRRFERSESFRLKPEATSKPEATWKEVGTPISIVVGKNGSAWDPMLEPVVPGPVKAEGDGRSPAGIFTLGTAFGYAPAADAAWLKLPYLHVTEGIECVDDAASTSYNQIVNRRTIAKPDWNSSEKMREVGEAYEWGVVINYNASPAVPRHGSCVFMHIGGKNGKGTAGCTATNPTDLHAVMAWLDPKASPALVQLPKAAYEKVRGAWQLP